MIVNLKGSKSISNRALLLREVNKILGLKVPRLINLSTSDDTVIMQKGLKLLTQKKTPKTINLGLAGTAVRFLTAFAAALGKEVTITGSKRMKKRPIDDLVKALNNLGCNIECTNGCPPIKIHKSEFLGGETEISSTTSSQFLSALLMVAPLAKNEVKLIVTGERVSAPYIDMTLEMMEIFKAEPKEFFIEGDASSASYLGAYALLKDVELQIGNISEDSIQGDIKFLEYIKKIEKNGTLGTIDMNATPDLVMTFAILAAVSKGKTRLTNIANLKVKESDRLQALKNELTKLQIKVKTGKDFIEIEGQDTAQLIEKNAHKRITIETYSDHRIAMAFGVLKKTILPRLKIRNPSVVSKSYPEFWSDLNRLNRVNKSK